MGVLLLGILAGLAACTHSKSIVPSAVTLFRDNADELKMYAAVLAATEPLRSQRDAVHYISNACIQHANLTSMCRSLKNT